MACRWTWKAYGQTSDPSRRILAVETKEIGRTPDDQQRLAAAFDAPPPYQLATLEESRH